ncbi:MAG: hypothetical protein Q3996_02635 [Candidatus Saccharibacteria bacterium]|nr:hypothetical protein [Candidatus Saccharibacteria bacterium]
MVKYYVKTIPNKFFLFNAGQLLKVIIIGGLFGFGVALLAKFGISMSTSLAAYRVALVILSLITIGVLLQLKIDLAVLITVSSVMVMWRIGLVFSDALWQMLLVQTLLMAIVMGAFGWISQLRQWRPRIVITVLVIIILSLI